MASILKLLGHVVKCPENIMPEQHINIDDYKFQLLNVPEYLTWLAVGKFNGTLTVNNLGQRSDKPSFCGIFKYSLKPQK